MTRRLRSKLGESLASIEEQDKPLAKVATSSLLALRYYTIAAEYTDKAEWNEAIPFYRRAIEVDSSFATAYSSLGSLSHSMGNISEALKYSSLAMKWIHIATEREKYFIKGEYYRLRNDFKNAIENYKILTTLYPDHFTAHNNLAFMYQFTRQYGEAIEEYNELHRISPESWYIHQGMGLTYCGLGENDKAMAKFRHALEINPKQYWSHVGLGAAYLIKGGLEEAKNQFEKLLLQNERWQSIGEDWFGIYYKYIGKINECLDHMKNGIRIDQRIGDKSSEADKRIALAEILRQKKNAQASLAEFQKAVEVWPSAENLEKLGEEYARRSMFGDADKILRKLENFAEKEDTQHNVAYVYRLKGELDYYRGNYSQAIENLETSKSFADVLETRVSLGRVYTQLGDHEKAIEEYEYILEHRYATFFDDVSSLWPLSHYWLALVYETKGDTSNAIKYYNEFLTIWEDADPDIIEVADAKVRMAALSGKRI
jgi:tetratricopeptide (TPR) repeat protein